MVTEPVDRQSVHDVLLVAVATTVLWSIGSVVNAPVILCTAMNLITPVTEYVARGVQVPAVRL